MIDGVKINFPEGWVLVLPDGNEAFCHIWAEGTSDVIAKEYLDEYAKKVEEWQKVTEPETAAQKEATDEKNIFPPLESTQEV